MGARVLIPFLILSNAAVVGGVVTMMRGERQGAPAAEPAASAPEGEDDPETHFPLQFVVRVRSGDNDRYVRAGYEVLLADTRDRERLLATLPRVRDAVLAYFLDRTLDELTGSAGIERSKRAVRERVQRALGHPIREIYLTDFVVN
jgi:flagellar basal body-associated protein FliL